MTIDERDIARICHEANRALQIALADPAVPVSPPWDDAPADQHLSALMGVCAHRDNPDLTPRQSHELWMEHKLAEGWVHGPVKDPEAKTHPCLVPYEELSEGDRVKDELFSAIVRALT